MLAEAFSLYNAQACIVTLQCTRLISTVFDYKI